VVRVSPVIRGFYDAQKYDNSEDTAANISGEGGKSATALLRRTFEESVKAGPDERAKTLELVTEGITTTMAEMLFIEKSGINPGKSVAEHGVDSLIPAELRSWFHVALGSDITMLDLLDARTSVSTLAVNIVQATGRNLKSG
jgi:Phosphopantetheine attachment site